MSLPSFEIMKNAYIDNLDYIVKESTLLQPINKNIINILKDRAKSCSTWNELGTLACITPNLNTGMKFLSPMTKAPYYTTCLQYGSASSEWYFMYSYLQTYSYTFIIFAIPLFSPIIGEKYGISSENSYIYSFSFGFGNSKTKIWKTTPNIFIQANYNVISQSEFNWSGIFSPTDGINTAIFNCISLGNFYIHIKTNDYEIEGTLSSQIGPSYNSSNGCCPCISGNGSIYWSYTNMKSEATITENGSQIKEIDGIGWFDHQWAQAGRLESETVAAIKNIVQVFKPPKINRWYWLTINDYNQKIQFMIVISNVNLLNNTTDTPSYKSTSIAKYNNYDVPQFYTDKANIKILESKKIGDYIYPTKYSININLDKGYNYILQGGIFGDQIINLPTTIPNWEGCGDVYDKNGNKIGTGFLEANQVSTEKVITDTTLNHAGISLNNSELFYVSKSNVNAFVVICSFIWLLFLLAFCILIIWIFYKIISKVIDCYKNKKYLKVKNKK